MYVRPTLTDPSFLQPYTNWSMDTDVSKFMHQVSLIEKGITQIFRDVLRGSCIRSDGSRALVLDVGANFGYYSLYAAKLGCRQVGTQCLPIRALYPKRGTQACAHCPPSLCRVIAWEPVPRFRAFFEWAVAANDLGHLITIRPRVVSDRREKASGC